MEIGLLETSEAHTAGSKCHLIQADGSVSDAFVVVQGPDSPAYRLAKRKQRNSIIKLREKGTKFDSYDFFPLDAEFASDIVTGWGEITKDGSPIKFSKSSCKKFFAKSPVNVDRVLDFCGERVNFMKG
jgi:hypothetical protein